MGRGAGAREVDVDAIAEVCARTSGVDAAYLFGSHATGRVHADSDIDIAVLLDRHVHPDRAARFDLRLMLSSEFIAALHHNEVDVVVLNDAPPMLARAVLRTGRRVWCADRERTTAFERQVQLRAADIEPAVRRSRRIAAQALQS